ncbi:hypothetical protein [Kocuria sp.]|uniref:hypothetical protein n=1 Tax=Kocuria sp. TaxID=1871328 RepID=UPI0026DCB796|nr:hypothetical protein [Kocuria sp.]MDO4920175.1 hypothetical protein [Kocuria sp.]
MALFLRRHRVENLLYAGACGFGLLGAGGFVHSYFSTDWSENFPVVPFFLVVAASSLTLTAVALSLVRLFHQDHRPDNPADLTDLPTTAGSHAVGPARRRASSGRRPR